MVHRNAPLSETGRLRLARCVVDDGWSRRRAAERFQVSVTTVCRWVDRYLELGEAGMADRSSRPHHSPNRTPTRLERRIIGVRVTRRWGPARIAYLLGQRDTWMSCAESEARVASGVVWGETVALCNSFNVKDGVPEGPMAVNAQPAGLDSARR